MGKTPPPKDFVFSDDDDESVEGGGIPDDDGMIYLKDKHGHADRGDSGERKTDAKKARVARRSVRRAPKRDC